MFGKLPLSIIRYPTGRYGFVGSVPAVLAYSGATDADLKVIAQSGPRIARLIAAKEGRTIVHLSWETEEDARAAATAAGFTPT